jgi:hypothetical protein
VLKDLGGEVESLRVKAKAENSMCKRNEVAALGPNWLKKHC